MNAYCRFFYSDVGHIFLAGWFSQKDNPGENLPADYLTPAFHAARDSLCGI
jgi:hypothetical protein